MSLLECVCADRGLAVVWSLQTWSVEGKGAREGGVVKVAVGDDDLLDRAVADGGQYCAHVVWGIGAGVNDRHGRRAEDIGIGAAKCHGRGVGRQNTDQAGGQFDGLAGCWIKGGHGNAAPMCFAVSPPMNAL